MIVSKDEEKALNKTQHHILKKKMEKKRKLGIKESHLNTIKLTYDSSANIILNEKAEMFFL